MDPLDLATDPTLDSQHISAGRTAHANDLYAHHCGRCLYAVFDVRASMALFMDNIAQHSRGDITINFTQPYPITRVEKAVLPVPGIIGLEAWGRIR